MLRFIDCSIISLSKERWLRWNRITKYNTETLNIHKIVSNSGKSFLAHTYIIKLCLMQYLSKKKYKDYLIQVWFCSRRRGCRGRRRFLSPGRGRRTFSDNSHRHGTNLRGRRPSACLSYRTSRFVCGEEQTGHVTLQGRTRVANLLPVQRREGGRFAATGFRRPSHRH